MGNTLQHVGIMGMHWGHRKDDGSPGHVSHPSADHATVAVIRKKKLSEMSNEEIQKMATTMQLENQYKKLNPGKVSAGKRYVAGVLSGSAKQALIPLAASGMTIAGLYAKKLIVAAVKNAALKKAAQTAINYTI